MLLRGEIKDGVPKCRYGIIRCYEKVGNTLLVIHNYLIQSRKCTFPGEHLHEYSELDVNRGGGTEVTSRAHILTKEAASSHLSQTFPYRNVGTVLSVPLTFLGEAVNMGCLCKISQFLNSI